MEDCCAVCAEPLEWVGYGHCGHRDVCFMCVARLRFVLNEKHCCICKQNCPTVYVTRALGEYTRIVTDWEPLLNHSKSSGLGNLWYEELVEAYFDDEEPFKIIEGMCGLSCSICEGAIEGESLRKGTKKKGYKFKSLEGLLIHQAKFHKVYMCQLCLEGRKAFISEQKLYTKSQLRKHVWTGNSGVDGDEGFAGHPMCGFCQEPFYDDNELYQHMARQHYTCHICQRARPDQYEYYRNYDELQFHFRQRHSLCENQECLAKKFVVFPSEAELKRHNASAHPEVIFEYRRPALQIPVTFEYRRPGQDSSNFNGGSYSSRRGGRGRLDARNAQPTAAEVDRNNLAVLENAIQESLNMSVATNQSGDESRGIHFRGDGERAITGHLVGSLTQTEGDVQIGNSRSFAAVEGWGRPSVISSAAFPPLSGASQNTGQIGNSRFLAAVAGGGRSSAITSDAAFPPLPGASQNTRRQARVENQNSPSIVSAIFNGSRSGRTARSGIRVLNKADHRSSGVSSQPSRSFETAHSSGTLHNERGSSWTSTDSNLC